MRYEYILHMSVGTPTRFIPLYEIVHRRDHIQTIRCRPREYLIFGLEKSIRIYPFVFGMWRYTEKIRNPKRDKGDICQ